MAIQWLRRAWLLAATALLLAACGGGSIESPLQPSRVINFGDAMGDLGNNSAGARYTVNDGSINNWTQVVASGYGRALTARSAGGLAFATGNARVTARPDAAGNSSTPTVQEQIDAFLAADHPAENDLILVSAGTSDMIVQLRGVLDGSQTEDQARANLETAAREFGAQVRRLVQAGAKHTIVIGPYNLGHSVWALQTGQTGLMERTSTRFTDALLISMVDLGANVLFVDAALLFNLDTNNPSSAALDNVVDTVCTTVDPGPGIGTGANQVNSVLCTPATVIPGSNYTRYMFADRIYPTPRGHQLLGDFALSRSRERW
jgi:phospholipase/lecithinase/hemolysin